MIDEAHEATELAVEVNTDQEQRHILKVIELLQRNLPGEEIVPQIESKFSLSPIEAQNLLGKACIEFAFRQLGVTNDPMSLVVKFQSQLGISRKRAQAIVSEAQAHFGRLFGLDQNGLRYWNVMQQLSVAKLAAQRVKRHKCHACNKGKIGNEVCTICGGRAFVEYKDPNVAVMNRCHADIAHVLGLNSETLHISGDKPELGLHTIIQAVESQQRSIVIGDEELIERMSKAMIDAGQEIDEDVINMLEGEVLSQHPTNGNKPSHPEALPEDNPDEQ